MDDEDDIDEYDDQVREYVRLGTGWLIFLGTAIIVGGYFWLEHINATQ